MPGKVCLLLVATSMCVVLAPHKTCTAAETSRPSATVIAPSPPERHGLTMLGHEFVTIGEVTGVGRHSGQEQLPQAATTFPPPVGTVMAVMVTPAVFG